MKIKILSALLGAALLFSACNDKWLEEVKPDDGTLTPEIIFKSEAGVDVAFTGMHAYLRSINLGIVPTFGFISHAVTYSFMGNDIIASDNSSLWWSDETLWDMSRIGNEAGSYQSAYYWQLFYYVVNNANSIMVGLEESPLSPEMKAAYSAEAQVMRGWCHWHLARIYAKPYSEANRGELCLPYLEKPASGSAKGKGRESIGVVYDKIMADMTDEIIEKMYDTRKPGMEYRLDKYIAYAFRARVELEMGKYPEAAASAAKALAGPYVQTSNARYVHGFNLFAKDWMWGVPRRTDQSALYGMLYAWTDFRQGFVNGYTQFHINTSFVDKFSDTDIRKTQFLTYNSTPGSYNNKITMKFLSRDASFTGDYCYLRTSELTLIQAEGLARSGATGPAQDKLFEIQGLRDPQAVKSTNSGAALIEEILLERRKELYGEIGVEYFDLRRLQRPLIRDGNMPSGARFNVQPGDDRWLFQIPVLEMQANPFMKGQQNPRN